MFFNNIAVNPNDSLSLAQKNFAKLEKDYQVAFDRYVKSLDDYDRINAIINNNKLTHALKIALRMARLRIAKNHKRLQNLDLQIKYPKN